MPIDRNAADSVIRSAVLLDDCHRDAVLFADGPPHAPRSGNTNKLASKRRCSKMKIELIATVAVVAPDPPASRKLYVEALGLPLEGEGQDGYYSSEKIPGSNHFGVWPLSEAAEACFGTREWPTDQPIPQMSLEFEVESTAAVQAAADELRSKGFSLLHPAREEPWGDTLGRA
jgi:catechol 2,3-dioxygenase-like lactoylglutathione lyase family enzyme